MCADLREQVSDLDEIVHIENECFSPPIAYSRSVLKEGFESNSSVSLVAEHEKRIIAFILADVKTKRPDGYISSVDVRKAYRRDGIARQLVTAVESNFLARRCKRVVLEVGVENKGAIGLYESLGYQRIRKIPNYYADGTDAFEMAKEIGKPNVSHT